MLSRPGSRLEVHGQFCEHVSPNGHTDLFLEDAIVTAGATPAPSSGTGKSTGWLAATVVFRSS